MKTYSKGRIELRNLQFSKKMLPEKSSLFFLSDQPSEPKSLDVAPHCRSWKIRSENLRLRSTWRPFDSSFERKGALVTVEVCVLCGRWFSNQFDIVSKTPFSCDTVGRELLWAVLYSLLCYETDWNIFKPNRTFLVRFGGISGEFGHAMVRILARRSRAKIPMARPNEPDMPSKRTKKVRLGIYRTQIRT